MFIELFQVEPFRSQHVTCKISVLDANGKILVSTNGEYDFESTKLSWMFPCFVNSKWPFKSKDLHLPNNTICLLVEMQMSGAGADGMEQINFGEGLEELLVPLKESKDPTPQSNNLTPSSLMNKLLNFYKDGKLFDVIGWNITKVEFTERTPETDFVLAAIKARGYN